MAETGTETDATLGGRIEVVAGDITRLEVDAMVDRYPPDEACVVAVSAVTDWLRAHEASRTVIFCCFDESSTSLYRRRLGLDG